jgi:hypothetical protein
MGNFANRKKQNNQTTTQQHNNTTTGPSPSPLPQREGSD